MIVLIVIVQLVNYIVSIIFNTGHYHWSMGCHYELNHRKSIMQPLQYPCLKGRMQVHVYLINQYCSFCQQCRLGTI